MMPKPLIAWFAATAFVCAAALMSAASRGGLQPGTWNWPSYAGTEGGAP
jgi:hypothetical protein